MMIKRTEIRIKKKDHQSLSSNYCLVCNLQRCLMAVSLGR